MTKTGLLAACGGRDHVADLDLLVGDDYTVNEQFDQLAFLFKARLFESGTYSLTKLLHGLGDPGQLHMFGGAGFQLTHLSGNSFQALFQFVPSPLVFFQGNHTCQICIRQPFRLMLNAHTCLAQILPACLQFLR
jgi:hypothetical protein